MKKIDAKEYVSSVKDGIVIVDFMAQWCGPCKMLTPVLIQLEKDLNIRIVSVDVDEQKDLSAALQIRSVPTLQIFKDGVLAKVIYGYHPKEMLEEIINKLKTL